MGSFFELLKAFIEITRFDKAEEIITAVMNSRIVLSVRWFVCESVRTMFALFPVFLLMLALNIPIWFFNFDKLVMKYVANQYWKLPFHKELSLYHLCIVAGSVTTLVSCFIQFWMVAIITKLRARHQYSRMTQLEKYIETLRRHTDDGMLLVKSQMNIIKKPFVLMSNCSVILVHNEAFKKFIEDNADFLRPHIDGVSLYHVLPSLRIGFHVIDPFLRKTGITGFIIIREIPFGSYLYTVRMRKFPVHRKSTDESGYLYVFFQFNRTGSMEEYRMSSSTDDLQT